MTGKPITDMTPEELSGAARDATAAISEAGFTIRAAVHMLQDIDRERFIRNLTKAGARPKKAPTP